MNKIHHYFKNVFSFKLSTPTAVILGAVVISIGIVTNGYVTQTIANKNQPQAPNGQPAPSVAKGSIFKGKSIDSNDYIEGSADNKIVVIEYSDTECPFCIMLSPTMEQLRAEYKDKITFVYRHFPLTTIHKNAMDESKAITCAGKLGGSGKYYEYVDTLFKRKVSLQSQTNPSPAMTASDRTNIASSIGLNIANFNSCMSDKNTEEIVTAEMKDGTIAGVKGTPATFILKKTRKGYEVSSMVDGARDKAFFNAAIDEALNK